MNKKNFAIILLMLLTAIIVERSVPHHHVEKDGFVIADFSNDEKHDHQEEETEDESLHSSYFPSEIMNGFEVPFVILRLVIQQNPVRSVSRSQTDNYNILPKVLNSILNKLHWYSAKAPPFFN